MQSDWNQLVGNVRNAQKEAASSREALRITQQERNKEINRLQQKMEQRELIFSETVDDLKSSLRDTVKQHKQEMNQQRRVFQDSMVKQSEKFDEKLDHQWDRTVDALHEVQAWTQEELARQESEFHGLMKQQQQQIDSVRTDVNTIMEKEAINSETAQMIIRDVERLIRETKDTYPEHEKFAPGQLQNLKRRLEAARSDISTNPGGAISQGKERLFDVLELQQHLEQKEWEFNDWYGRTKSAFKSLFETIRNNRDYSLGNEENSARLEIDYWTLGELGILEEQVSREIERMENQRSRMSLEELKELLKSGYPEREKQFDSLLTTAIGRAIASQVRAEMADSIQESFESQGYSILASGYEQGDQRRAYLVKVRNRSGNELVVMISPDETLSHNTIDMTVEKGNIPPELRNELDQKIRKDLKDAGVDMGELECSNDHIKGIYDVESIIKAGSKGISQKSLQDAGLLNNEIKNVRNADQNGNQQI